MKKDLGLLQSVVPAPVFMVGTYDEDGKVDVMNMTWAQVCDMDKIILFIGENKKTWKNIQDNKAFTVAVADKAHMDVADFFGIATGNKMSDKFERSGQTAVKSDLVNAPIIEAFPLVMECELLEVIRTEHLTAIVGKILNTKADEEVLNEEGEVDLAKLQALMYFDAYYEMGGKVGQAWGEGRKFMKLAYDE